MASVIDQQPGPVAEDTNPIEILPVNGTAIIPAGNSTTDVTVASSDVSNGPRKTPFAHPSSPSSPPKEQVLTIEEETKYNSLLNGVSSWTALPTSSASNASVEPITEAEIMWLTRECLLRYLRASKWIVVDAKTRLFATLMWRREYGVAKHSPEYISIENEKGKQLILGYDKEQRPCHYLIPSNQNTPRSDRQIEHLVFMLERAIDLMGPGQETLALLINFSDTSSGQGASIAQGRQTMNILQSHYPERLGLSLLINLPWAFLAFYKLITPFIDPLTRKKLIFNEDMRLHVPPEQLLKTHGGDVDFEYDHSVYWPALNQLAEERRKEQYARWVKGGKRYGELESYLKGGQEQSLKDLVNKKVDGFTERSGNLYHPGKGEKAVNFSQDIEKLEESGVAGTVVQKSTMNNPEEAVLGENLGEVKAKPDITA